MLKQVDERWILGQNEIDQFVDLYDPNGMTSEGPSPWQEQLMEYLEERHGVEINDLYKEVHPDSVLAVEKAVEQSFFVCELCGSGFAEDEAAPDGRNICIECYENEQKQLNDVGSTL